MNDAKTAANSRKGRSLCRFARLVGKVCDEVRAYFEGFISAFPGAGSEKMHAFYLLLIGRELSKPSIYYDPYGVCDKDDRAAHGIPILSEQRELQYWLSALSP